MCDSYSVCFNQQEEVKVLKKQHHALEETVATSTLSHSMSAPSLGHLVSDSGKLAFFSL